LQVVEVQREIEVVDPWPPPESLSEGSFLLNDLLYGRVMARGAQVPIEVLEWKGGGIVSPIQGKLHAYGKLLKGKRGRGVLALQPDDGNGVAECPAVKHDPYLLVFGGG
jgi:hypothetical protein